MALSPLAQHGELHPHSMVAVNLAHGSLDAHRQLPDGEGDFHGLIRLKVRRVFRLDQAASEAQVCDPATNGGSGGKAADVRLSTAQKPWMLPAIPLRIGHAAPSRHRA